jgi:hypothetical protein
VYKGPAFVSVKEKSRREHGSGTKAGRDSRHVNYQEEVVVGQTRVKKRIVLYPLGSPYVACGSAL